MRYYDIRIVPENTSATTSSATGTTVTASKTLRFTTHPNGTSAAPDMGALHVIFDLPITTFDAPNGSAYVEIRGVDITIIAQASNLQGAEIKIYGGMGTGYPLADPKQSGLLLFGSVYQAFGNWLDTDMSLNLLVQPFSVPITDENYPKLVWHWQKGQSIQTAIQNAITAAMPGYSCNFSLSTPLTAGSDDLGFYSDFGSIAEVIKSVSMAANQSAGYDGIKFFVRQNTFYFYDNADKSNPKSIKFNDLIGQPTWLGPADSPHITLQTVMRADIAVGDVITMPKFNQPGSNQSVSGYGLVAPSSANYQSPKNRSLFDGNFQISSVRHIGDSRNPDGGAWVTVFEAYSV